MTLRSKHIATLAVIGTAGALSLGATAGAAPARCGSLHLKGLTVAAAKQRAKHAGCAIRLRGAKVSDVHRQTIARTRARSAAVTAWVNPLCRVMGAPGPGIEEPAITPGPTELVSGLFTAGGPLELVSAPDCSKIVGTPLGGTITVRDGTGAVVASRTVTEGNLATIPLAPGSYTITGTFARGGETPRRPVTIAAGQTVREDAVEPVP